MDDPAARVGDLDADGLLAGDRGEDADVRGGERVGEVVLELGDLADLDAGREPQLVAGDVRPGDHADDVRLDAEVAERLDELGGGLLLPGRVGPVRVARRAGEEARVGDVQTNSGESVTDAAVAAAGVSSSSVDLAPGPARITPGSSVSGSSARRGASGSSTGSAAGVAGSGGSGSSCGSGSPCATGPASLVEVGEAVGARPEVLLARRALARGGVTAVNSDVSSSASSSRAVRMRVVTAVRTGSARSRTRRPVVVTESPVALSTPATLAPVSSSTPARKTKIAMTCAPTSPSSVEVPS